MRPLGNLVGNAGGGFGDVVDTGKRGASEFHDQNAHGEGPDRKNDGVVPGEVYAFAGVHSSGLQMAPACLG